jgi:hypothetical protein
MNPPHLSIGNWVIGPNSGTALIKFQGTGTTTTVLPIELTTFEGKNNENQNLLTWATASENQNKGFDIERSLDGNRFEKIGFVVGNGTTTQTQRYSFEDKNASGLMYYRLKQLDFDGRFEYSKIIVLQNENSKQNTLIYPNPSQGIFNILASKNDDKMLVFNEIGVLVRSFDTALNELDLSDLPSGMYWVAIGEEKVKVVRM